MSRFLNFLKGKKTYISAAALALIALLGFYFGAINGTESLALLTAAGAAAGLGAKSERYGQALLAALSDVRDAQGQHKPLDVKALAGEIIQSVTTQTQQNCDHDIGKFIGDGKFKCMECGDVFTPTPEQIEKWKATTKVEIPSGEQK